MTLPRPQPACHGPIAPNESIEQADAVHHQAERDGRGPLSRRQIAAALSIDATRPAHS